MLVLHVLSQWRTPFLTELFGFITRFGEETVAILVICTLFWCVNKRLGYGVGIAFFLSGLLVQGLKIGFRVDRPWIRDPAFQPAPEALEKATGYSFPSGHTQTATAIFGAIAFAVTRWRLRAPLIAIPLLVALSRMVLGVHTPLDVTVSLVLTTVISAVVMRWMAAREPFFPSHALSVPAGQTLPGEVAAPSGTAGLSDHSRTLLLSALVAITSFGLMGFATGLYSRNLMDAHYLADSFKMAGSGIGFAVGHYVEKRFVRFSTRTRRGWMQPVKVLLGVGVLLGLQQGLKLVLGAGAGANAVRYALMICWALAIWPALFSRIFILRAKN
jgi:undecaprenyl-diphosphatase